MLVSYRRQLPLLPLFELAPQFAVDEGTSETGGLTRTQCYLSQQIEEMLCRGSRVPLDRVRLDSSQVTSLNLCCPVFSYAKLSDLGLDSQSVVPHISQSR